MYDLLNFVTKTAAEMRAGVYDYTVEGRCSGCGSCCSNLLPISNKEAKTIADYIKKHGVKEYKRRFPTAKTFTDMSCPFRDDTEKKCLIYPVRPAICREFQCDKPRKRIEADRKMFHKKYEVVMMRETFFPEE